MSNVAKWYWGHFFIKDVIQINVRSGECSIKFPCISFTAKVDINGYDFSQTDDLVRTVLNEAFQNYDSNIWDK